MSNALGRLILSPSTTSDPSLRQPKNPSHFSLPNFLKQSYHRRNSHGRKDGHVGLCSDEGKSILRTRRGCLKLLKRFSRLYFGRRSFTAAVIPGGFGSIQPEDYDFDRDGLDGGGGDGGKEDNGGEGGGGSFDGGDSRLEGFPIWWWWQWLKQQPGSRNGIKFKYSIPTGTVWSPEEQTDRKRSGEQVKKYGSDILNAIRAAILTPFVILAIAIAGPSYAISCPFTFFLYFSHVMFITMHLVSGTILLLKALLLWWIWRWIHRRGSAGEDGGEDGGYRQEDSGEDSGDDYNDEL